MIVKYFDSHSQLRESVEFLGYPPSDSLCKVRKCESISRVCACSIFPFCTEKVASIFQALFCPLQFHKPVVPAELSYQLVEGTPFLEPLRSPLCGYSYYLTSPLTTDTCLFPVLPGTALYLCHCVCGQVHLGNPLPGMVNASIILIDISKCLLGGIFCS